MKIYLLSVCFLLLSSTLLEAQKGCVNGDCENGWGTYVYDGGDAYTGFWKNGQRNFFGTYFWPDGAFFTGVFKDDKRQPQGIFKDYNKPVKYSTEPTQFSEKGCVSGDCEEGYGVYIYTSGAMYAGCWKNGKQHYWGAYFGNDDYFIGLYKAHTRQNRGIAVKRDGTVNCYTDQISFPERGCVLGNCEDGFGLYIWNSGGLYAGSWKNGKKDYWAARFWEYDFFYGVYRDDDRQERGLYVYSTGKMEFEVAPVNFERTIQATPVASTVHILLFTDTDDSRVGSSCEETNKYFKRTFVNKVKKHTGMEVRFQSFSGENDFTRDKLESTIAQLNTQPNDVIFFYYSGHGYNQGEGNYPTLTLGMTGEPLSSRQKALTDIYKSLQKKPHRLLITISEACNKIYQARNDIRTGSFYGTFDEAEDMNRHFAELFQHASGDYLVTSSQKDQLSHLATGQPGFFTCAFRDAFAEVTGKSNSQSATWEEIFNRAIAKTRKSAADIGERQTPQWCKGTFCN